MSSHPTFRSGRDNEKTLLRTTGQVARLPVGRGAERRVVNLAADLREEGSQLADVEVADLSTDGFMMRCPLDLAPGALVWLKLSGCAPMKAEIVWAQDGKAGCRFTTPLYPAILDQIIAGQAKPGVRRLFTPPVPQPEAGRSAA
jgi:hypothetical protein